MVFMAFRPVKLHDLRDLLQLFLQAAQGAAEGLHAVGCSASSLRRDSVASGDEKAANEIGSLPGVQARLHQVFAQAGEISLGEFFDVGMLCLCHLLFSRSESTCWPYPLNLRRDGRIEVADLIR